MKSWPFWKRTAVLLAAACLFIYGCGSSNSGKTRVVVTLNASAVTVLVNQTFQFAALVTGATDTTVAWTLTSIPTGSMNATPTACSPGCGTLSDPTKSPVTYTAPATVPNPAQTITITATANADKMTKGTATIALDSGIRVTVTPSVATIGTSESFSFTATVVNDLTDPAKSGVTWSVKETSAGTVDATGKYTAPATVPNPATATIVATSKADTSRTGTATVTIVTAATPTFSGISPTKAPLGGIFQDVYLTATNLRSTSTILLNGNPLPISQITVFSSGVARVRLNDTQLSVPGAFQFAIQGAAPPAMPIPDTITIAAVRPALVASLPDSQPQSSLSGSLTLDGGYYGPSSGPIVSGLFDGSTRTVTTATARQLNVALNPGDLSNLPGLYQVGVANGSAPQPLALTNFAIQPSPASPSLAGANLPLGTGASPSAITLDRTRGIAFVAEKGKNQVQRLDFTAGNWTLSSAVYPVGSGPVGLAVDDSRQILVTANSGDTQGESVSIVNYQAGTKLGAIDLRIVTNPGGTPPSSLPAAVGLDPASGLGFVALATSNIGFVFNYDATKTVSSSNFQCIPGTGSLPYCAIGVITLASGAGPQIAVEPRLRWTFVTPGGAGLMSIVDLKGQTPVAISSIQRAANIVTVKTATPHNLNPANPGTVLISGVPAGKGNTNFNGSFAVASIVDSSTFTFNQTAADDSPNAAGGQVNFSGPLLTFTVTNTIQGIAINPITETAVLADPNATFSQIHFLSTLDQTSTSFSLTASTGGVSGPEVGASGVSFQPFTNVAVSVNPVRNELSMLDPVKLTRLAVVSTAGTGSGAVAVDPASNIALVANSGSDDVSVISLGGIIHSPQILEVRVPPGPGSPFPQGVFTSSSGAPVQIFGAGFSGSPQVRLDGTVIPGATVISDREIDVTIPAAFLASPRRFALDVVNGGMSNASDFSVAQSVDLSGVCATPSAPSGVAIDEDREIAVVANSGCNNVSLIDLTNGAVKQSIAVGTSPLGVAVNSRLGLAVVSNNGSSNASVLDLNQGTLKTSVTVGTSPSGVAINPASGIAYVTNSGSNTLGAIDLNAATLAAVSIAVDQRPISVAVDPDHSIALVGALNLATNPPAGQLDIVDISKSTPAFTGSRVPISVQLPTGIVFDPVSQDFFAVSSLSNSFVVANVQTNTVTAARVGVNPASLALNYQSSTLVTVNAVSNTISVVDVEFDSAKGFQSLRTRATLGLGSPLTNAGSANPQFAAAVHSRTNLAVITDAANNRVLLLPLPR